MKVHFINRAHNQGFIFAGMWQCICKLLIDYSVVPVFVGLWCLCECVWFSEKLLSGSVPMLMWVTEILSSLCVLFCSGADKINERFRTYLLSPQIRVHLLMLQSFSRNRLPRGLIRLSSSSQERSFSFILQFFLEAHCYRLFEFRCFRCFFFKANKVGDSCISLTSVKNVEFRRNVIWLHMLHMLYF